MKEIIVELNGASYLWYRYDEPLEILNAQDINRIEQNALTLATALRQKGYNIPNLSMASAGYNSQLIEIVDKLNSVECNLDILNSEEILSIFYGKPVRKEAGDLAHNKAEVWRWVQVLEEILEILQGLKPKWGYLLCTDGYPTTKGKRIVVRGDYIG